jgi:hypothetical protein
MGTTARARWPVALVLAGCGEADEPGPDVFSPEIERMVMEVDYQVGAEPVTAWNLEGSPWDLTAFNVAAMFAASPRDIEVPRTLGQMEAIDPGPGDTFDIDRILEVSEAYRDVPNTGTEVGYHVLFFDGAYLDEDGRQDAVLGVSIGDTGVIALFKPAIGRGRQATFVEQTTVIHELGHALGPVDRGVPMVQDHRDAEHGHHCTHDGCVMVWANEEPRDLVQFIQSYVKDGTDIVVGPQCQADLDAALARAR